MNTSRVYANALHLRQMLVALVVLVCTAFTPSALSAGTWEIPDSIDGVTDMILVPDAGRAIVTYHPLGAAHPSILQVAVFNILTGEQLFAIEQGNTMAVSPSDFQIFVMYNNQHIDAYDMATGERRRILSGTKPFQPQIGISRNGKELVLLLQREHELTVQAEQYNTSGVLLARATHTYPAGCIAQGEQLSPDGELCGLSYFTGKVPYDTNTVVFMNNRTGQYLSSATLLHNSEVGVSQGLYFSNDNTMCAIAGSLSSGALYSTATGEQLYAFTGWGTGYFRPPFRFLNNDGLLLLPTMSNTFSLWNIHTKEFAPALTVPYHISPDFVATQPNSPLVGLYLINHGCDLPTKRYTGFIGVYNAATNSLAYAFASLHAADIIGNAGTVPSAFSVTGEMAAFSSPAAHRTYVLSRKDGSILQTLPMGGIFAFAPGDTSLLIADGTVFQEWLIRTGTQIGASQSFGDTVRSIYTSPASTIAAFVADSSVVLREYTTGQTRHIALPGELIVRARFDRSGSKFSAITRYGRLYSWETATGNLIDTLPLTRNYGLYFSESCDISPNGYTVAVRDLGTIKFIDIATGAIVAETEKLHNRDYFRAVYCSFTADGSHLVTTAIADTNPINPTEVSTRIRVFRTSDGAMVYDTLMPPDIYVSSISPSSDHVMAMDCSGNVMCIQLPQSVVTTIRDYGQPNSNAPLAVFPNPTAGETIVSYTLAHTGIQQIDLALYSAQGQKVITLVQERRTAGSYTMPFSAASLPSGVYYLVLTANGHRTMAPLTILR